MTVRRACLLLVALLGVGCSLDFDAIRAGDAGSPRDASPPDSGRHGDDAGLDSGPGSFDAGPDAPLDGASGDAGSEVPHPQWRSCGADPVPGCGVLTIPGGAFTLGQVDARNAAPVRSGVEVSGFALDVHEVTVARFRRFWAADAPEPPTVPISYPGGTASWAGPVVAADFAESDHLSRAIVITRFARS
jgi:hypothetical protein